MLTSHSSPCGKPPGFMALFQDGIVVPKEDKSSRGGQLILSTVTFLLKEKHVINSEALC